MPTIKINDLKPEASAKLTEAEISRIMGGGDVDGRDFLVWQRNPGVVDAADYVVWRKNLGTGL